jgi:MYXO-CTERM domain-containing protein
MSTPPDLTMMRTGTSHGGCSASASTQGIPPWALLAVIGLALVLVRRRRA